MHEPIRAALPFALRPADGKACAFSADEAATLSLSGEARSDLLIAPSGERPESGRLLGVPPCSGLIPRTRHGPAQSTKTCVQQQTEIPPGPLRAVRRFLARGVDAGWRLTGVWSSGAGIRTARVFPGRPVVRAGQIAADAVMRQARTGAWPGSNSSMSSRVVAR